jgi:hypothetical protein
VGRRTGAEREEDGRRLEKRLEQELDARNIEPIRRITSLLAPLWMRMPSRVMFRGLSVFSAQFLTAVLILRRSSIFSIYFIARCSLIFSGPTCDDGLRCLMFFFATYI